jgi:phosphoribosylanthranilate isomerase
MKIKICGIKNLEDAIFSSEMGADYLGFNFYQKSIRFITPNKCKQIVEEIKLNFPHVICVGVFVNNPKNQVASILEKTSIRLAQFSGDEPTSLLEFFGDVSFKAIRPKNMEDAQKIINSIPPRSASPEFLIDNYEYGSFGGTGKTGNWSIAKHFAKSNKFFLAGGLNPDNIENAINTVNPWGVDVASGVEKEKGVKDSILIKQFIKLARTTHEKKQMEKS